MDGLLLDWSRGKKRGLAGILEREANTDDENPNPSITVYKRTDNGNAAPQRTIVGALTGLSSWSSTRSTTRSSW